MGTPESITVEYATTDVGGSNVVPIETYIVHEKFDLGLIKNDIGLIKLKEPLKFDLHGSIAKLAMFENQYRTGTPTTVAGWGRIGTGLPLSTTLQKVDLQIYSFYDCKAAHKENSELILITNICAGVPEMGKAECNGDSGELIFDFFLKIRIYSF